MSTQQAASVSRASGASSGQPTQRRQEAQNPFAACVVLEAKSGVPPARAALAVCSQCRWGPIVLAKEMLS